MKPQMKEQVNDNPKSIDELYSREVRSLRRFVRGKLSNTADADDIVQEAYLRLHRAQKKGHIKNLRGFLYRIATNLVIDHYRAVRNNVQHLEFEETPQSALALVVEQTSPEEQTVVREQLRVLLKCIEGLPPRCQQVFVLHRVNQFTQREIAEQLGISTQMVEKHIAKAVRICTERMRKFK